LQLIVARIVYVSGGTNHLFSFGINTGLGHVLWQPTLVIG
jgi:hypothetical protein